MTDATTTAGGLPLYTRDRIPERFIPSTFTRAEMPDELICADHYGEIDRATWSAHFPHFSPEEIADRRNGALVVSPAALEQLEALRTALGAPMLVTSAYRREDSNAQVGGARRSQHMVGTAFDVMVQNHRPGVFVQCARECGFDGIGTYPRQGFIHVDNRGFPARWGDAFPADTDATRFTPPAPSRSPLATSTGQTAVAGGAAAIAASETAPDMPATVSANPPAVVDGGLNDAATFATDVATTPGFLDRAWGWLQSALSSPWTIVLIVALGFLAWRLYAKWRSERAFDREPPDAPPRGPGLVRHVALAAANRLARPSYGTTYRTFD